MLTTTEMPYYEQFLHVDFNYFSTGDCSCAPLAEDMESGQCSNHECVRADAKAYGEHEELWRIPRNIALS